MAGYLDHYGEGDERREKRRTRLIIAVLALVLGLGTAYFFLRDYRQKAQVRQFVEAVQRKDYSAAYRMWGCTEAKPCRDYGYDKFLEDWGPKSRYGEITSYDIGRARRCGTGVIVGVKFGNNREEKFWVEGKEMTIGYSPWPVCPPR